MQEAIVLFEHETMKGNECVTYIFYTDGTYRCSHWKSSIRFLYKIDPEKGLMFCKTQGYWNRWDPDCEEETKMVEEKIKISKNFLETLYGSADGQ